MLFVCNNLVLIIYYSISRPDGSLHTVSYSSLLSSLSSCVFDWFSSYFTGSNSLSGLTFTVRSHRAQIQAPYCSIYICCHPVPSCKSTIYADDTQLCISLSPDFFQSFKWPCQSYIRYWMIQNLLQLNKDKTESLVFGAGGQRQEIHSKLVSLSLKPGEQFRNPHVILDPELKFTLQI